MSVSKEDVKENSRSCKIRIYRRRNWKLYNEMNQILNYMEKLNELDTENVKPLSHPEEKILNVFREDVSKRKYS